MMNSKALQSFEELVNLADTLRPEIMRRANGIRWCWIAEWSSDTGMYEFGVKIDGQTLWQQFGLISRQHYKWIGRLNQREGISSEVHTAI